MSFVILVDVLCAYSLIFEQILALFTSIHPAWTIISLFWKRKYDILAAVWIMEEWDDEDIPLISVVTPNSDSEVR